MILTRVVPIFLLAAMASGCGVVTRSTTTTRTAVEVALLTQSLEDAIEELGVEAPTGGETQVTQGQSFHLVTSELASAVEKDYLISKLRERLLKLGLVEAKDKDSANLVVFPRVDYNQIDDHETLIGIPELEFQGFQTPEVKLFKFDKQKGRSKVSMYGTDASSGVMVFASDPVGQQRYYDRVTFLFIAKFKSTDLEEPF
ncbi:MAG: hypothetical protein RLY93_17015 [Sumerlaeia bacterium]